jgi:hypothetical protein
MPSTKNCGRQMQVRRMEAANKREEAKKKKREEKAKKKEEWIEKEREERKAARATKETAGKAAGVTTSPGVTTAKAGTIECGKMVGEGAPRITGPERGQTTAGENSGLRPLCCRRNGRLR